MSDKHTTGTDQDNELRTDGGRDEMEAHARKEQHDIDVQKAVATDGGTSTSRTSQLTCPDCGEPLRPGEVWEITDSSLTGTKIETDGSIQGDYRHASCPNDSSSETGQDNELRTDGGRDEVQYYVLDEDRAAVVAGPFDEQGEATDDADDRPPGHIVPTERVLDMFEKTSSATLRWETDEVDVITDGGEQVPFPIDWPYEAVVFGTDARMNGDCLALTGSGKPCTYNAYAGDYLCGTHQRTDDPTVLERAHQWARITDDETTLAVCLNCEEVWRGGTPPLVVDCPSCDAAAGERCSNDPDRPGSVGSAIPPHKRRRYRAQDVLGRYGPCPEGPVATDSDDQAELITDGGATPDDIPDDRYEETCEHCGVTVEAFTRECPSCGFRRDTFEHQDPETACIECGEENITWCGCCGFPLCGKHQELGGGFCRSFTTVSGVPVCVYDHAVYVGVWPPTEEVLTVDGSDVYHLPADDADGTTAPLCRPQEDGKTRESLEDATEDDRELCTLCEQTARQAVSEGGEA